MKRLLTALLTPALLLTPSSVLAATTGTVDASMTVGFSCDITHPTTATLNPVGQQATSSSNWTYLQNGDTEYQLSALTITGSGNLTGTIAVNDKNSTQLVTNSSTSGTAANQILGNDGGTGTINFTLNETVLSGFAAGNYVISSQLSCAEFAP